MAFFETIAVAFSVFSTIPMPRFDWNKKNMKYMLLAFPLVGVVTGAICVLWLILCHGLRLPGILTGAGLTLIPVLSTGGIHLDGYVDTCDALASHGDFEKKAKILRDPHIGAFAAIRTGAYFVLMLGVWSSLPEVNDSKVTWLCYGIFGDVRGLFLQIVLLFTISRILSALAVVSFKRTVQEDLLHVFYDHSDAKKVKIVLIVMDCIAILLLGTTGLTGLLMVLAAHLVYLFYNKQCIREFGGVSGDQAGWFLVQAEKWMAIVLVGMQYLLPAVKGGLF